MNRYVIERHIPGTGELVLESCEPQPRIQMELCGTRSRPPWVQSYVTADRIYCMYFVDRYYGESDLIVEYAGRRGTEFALLQVEPDTLAAMARGCNWSFELVRQTGGALQCFPQEPTDR